MGLRAAVKRAVYPIAKHSVKIYYHDRKVLVAKLKRAVYGNPSHIIDTHVGDLRHNGGKYALFLIWQPKEIAWYVENALVALKEAGVNTIVIANHPLSPDKLSNLKKFSHTILIRDNTGFDIGGYRDGTKFLANSAENIERVIYMNDSVYYSKKGLTGLITRLANSVSDICGTFENWEIHYHIQSFCFSVSDKIFHNEKFQKYWENYIPVNSRLWAIHAGEVGLSKTIVPLTEQIEIIYRANDLRSHLNKKEKRDLLNYVRLLPYPVRITYKDFSDLPKDAIVNEMIDRIYYGSQIHTGGFLFVTLLDCPIMKKDIFYRLQYRFDEIENSLRNIDTDGHTMDILTDMRKKSSVVYLPKLKRLQADSGIL